MWSIQSKDRSRHHRSSCWSMLLYNQDVQALLPGLLVRTQGQGQAGRWLLADFEDRARREAGNASKYLLPHLGM